MSFIFFIYRFKLFYIWYLSLLLVLYRFFAFFRIQWIICLVDILIVLLLHVHYCIVKSRWIPFFWQNKRQKVYRRSVNRHDLRSVTMVTYTQWITMALAFSLLIWLFPFYFLLILNLFYSLQLIQMFMLFFLDFNLFQNCTSIKLTLLR